MLGLQVVFELQQSHLTGIRIKKVLAIKAYCKMSLRFYRATYMLDDCEASNARILEGLNTTLHTLNTTGLSTQHAEWLKGNTTSNVTSGLQKCDLETFLTDVRVYLDSFSMLVGFCALSMIASIWPQIAGQNKSAFSQRIVLITITKAFERFT